MIYKLLRRLMWAVAAVCGAVAVAACGDDDAPAPIPPPEPDKPVGRAVLVYMLADNNLSTNGHDNLGDMIAAAADGALQGNRLIVYHDDRDADSPILKEVTADGVRMLKTYDNSLYSTDPERLMEVIADFKAKAPAPAMGMVFWSHAFGWQMVNAPADGPSALWLGQDKGRFMDVDQFARAMKGQGFDYVYFDCCHMASVESLYEMRRVADTFVASCAELPAAGTPYRHALRYLMADTPDLVAAARTTFDHYDAMTKSSRTCTMSVIDASALEPLATATRSIFSHHPQLPTEYSPQHFERDVELKPGEPVRRLFDFGDYVGALSATDPALEAPLAQWRDALDECVVWHAATPYIFSEIKIRAHSGLTSYIMRRPSDATLSGYNRLQWYADVASSLFPEQ